MSLEFSYRTRAKNLNRLKSESFDFLILGGGITGAAVARDAAMRGFRVALVEKGDFASGTSSVSSKLVHGGLRYLENYEFKLVFESLSERAWQLKDLSHIVRPLRFFIPVYKGEKRGMSLISIGLWLYDTLSLFRAPGLHHRHSKKILQEKLPGLKAEGLKGGFSYFDATMWDDLIVIETLRSAANAGALITNYTEALKPHFSTSSKDGSRHPQVAGYTVKDHLTGEIISIQAERVIVCAGPWTDRVGEAISEAEVATGLGGATANGKREERIWKKKLKPSRGIHLVFPREKIPVEGAVLMLHPDDGRVSFVMPRDDFGAGVVVVGTTDGPASADPDHQPIPKSDEDYILDLLNRFFPGLKLTEKDVISRYIGIRPLVGGDASEDGSASLQKVSREHWIETEENGVTYVAGGKYTTHRVMAAEIVDHAIASWDEGARKETLRRVPIYRLCQTKQTLLPETEENGMSPGDSAAVKKDLSRFGGEAPLVKKYDEEYPSILVPGLLGFSYLKGQFIFSIRHEMVVSLEDFFFRRCPLFLSRRDHGEPVVEALSQILLRERMRLDPKVHESDRAEWVKDLKSAIALRREVH
jgi:glycerol-3-phosphate dehydrogenase